MDFIKLDTNKKGHYSPAVISNNMVYISGQLPIDFNNNLLVENDIEVQTLKVLNNIETILYKVNLNRNNIVHMRIYIPDISLWDRVDNIYSKFFKEHKPARAVVPTNKLHHGALIEIEAIAELKG